MPANTKSPCIRHVTTGKKWLADIVGSDTFETDDSYAGSISTAGVFTAPATLTYAFHYAGNITGAIFVLNTVPYVFGRVKRWVKFYGRRA
jgi:hypothetical protein